jgi:hypothetical protein
MHQQKDKHKWHVAVCFLFVNLKVYRTNNIMSDAKFVDRVFKIMGFTEPDIPESQLTELQKERCDIGFNRFRGVGFLENGKVLKVITRTGGGNRLDYKENIRDIRDHSLYLADMDSPYDDTYAWWYFLVPDGAEFKITKCTTKLRRDFVAEDVVWNILNNSDYEMGSETDYSDQEDFTNRYGYWIDDPADPEVGDRSDTSDASMTSNDAPDTSMTPDACSDMCSDIKKMDIE